MLPGAGSNTFVLPTKICGKPGPAPTAPRALTTCHSSRTAHLLPTSRGEAGEPEGSQFPHAFYQNGQRRPSDSGHWKGPQKPIEGSPLLPLPGLRASGKAGRARLHPQTQHRQGPHFSHLVLVEEGGVGRGPRPGSAQHHPRSPPHHRWQPRCGRFPRTPPCRRAGAGGSQCRSQGPQQACRFRSPD